jgi:hypothetical protein
MPMGLYPSKDGTTTNNNSLFLSFKDKRKEKNITTMVKNM